MDILSTCWCDRLLGNFEDQLCILHVFDFAFKHNLLDKYHQKYVYKVSLQQLATMAMPS